MSETVVESTEYSRTDEENERNDGKTELPFTKV